MSSFEAVKQHRPKEQQQQTVIQSFSLKGHNGSVLCLDHSSNRASSFAIGADSTLVSGSEDGTCRLWDLRTGTRANLCIQCGSGDVLSVALGPKWSENPPLHQQSVPPFARDYSLYTAIGTKVLGYDLRNVTSPILSVPSAEFTFLEASDEINQIVFSPPLSSARSPFIRKQQSGRTSKVAVSNQSPRSAAGQVLLATADDSGVVRVTESIEGAGDDPTRIRPQGTRVYCHGESALVTAVAFGPRTPHGGKPVLLASGGTDCCIHLWDVGSSGISSKTRRSPLHSVTIPTTTTTESNKMCNPPMVHSLHWSKSGRLLAAGLGDGSIAILQQTASSSSSPLVLSARMVDAHNTAVASCFFPDWGAPTGHGENPAIMAHDRLLCSAGNDGCIVIWDLGSAVGGEKANDPAALFPMLQHDIEDGGAVAAMRRLRVSNTDDDAMIVDEPQTLCCVPHDAKPNWVVSSGSRDTSFPCTLFVADTSHTIRAYSIPIQ
jgi:WD repeat-containing protein 53